MMKKIPLYDYYRLDFFSHCIFFQLFIYWLTVYPSPCTCGCHKIKKKLSYLSKNSNQEVIQVETAVQCVIYKKIYKIANCLP